MKKIKEHISNAIKNDYPFVVYRKPNSTKVSALFQQDHELKRLLESDSRGFVFAPFEGENKEFIIPFENSICIESIFEESYLDEGFSIGVEEFEDVRKNHIELVKNGIDFINSSNVDKVVLSRKETIDVGEIDILAIFKRLCSANPNAFVYVWGHSITGIWMGASPETLLSVKNRKFNVMALASTQVYNGSVDVEWGAKEIQEHQYVIDYISDKIDDFDISVSNTYTVKAGNLLHLRADITGIFTLKETSLTPLIAALHPTPAICGMPMEESKSFILENENYNREYYTGYLGELNGTSVALFVNLRCMKIDLKENTADIYIGGGITKDSNPELEWQETVAKANVMKRVLR